MGFFSLWWSNDGVITCVSWVVSWIHLCYMTYMLFALSISILHKAQAVHVWTYGTTCTHQLQPANQTISLSVLMTWRPNGHGVCIQQLTVVCSTCRYLRLDYTCACTTSFACESPQIYNVKCIWLQSSLVSRMVEMINDISAIVRHCGFVSYMHHYCSMIYTLPKNTGTYHNYLHTNTLKK